jgi:hypothetical protein
MGNLKGSKTVGKVGIIVEMEVKYPVHVGETGWGNAGDVHGMPEV